MASEDMVTGPSGEGSSAGASSTAGAKGPKRFEIKKWNAVALWLGILWLTIVLSVATTSWIYVLNAKQIKQVQPVRSALWLGVSATMPSTSIA